MIDQGGEIIAVVAGIGPASDRRRGRKATVGEGDTGIVRGALGHLLPPGGVIAAQAMRKNDRRPSAGDFIVEAASRPLELTEPSRWHCLWFAHGHS